MKTAQYSHHFGGNVISPNIKEPLLNFIENLPFVIAPSTSTELRRTILDELQNNQGWSNEVKIQYQQGLTITSLKENVGLCIQTGNMSRFYADLLKLQALFLKDKINSAIFMIPTKKAASILGDNYAHSERLIRELQLFKHIITIPILVLSIE
ncbi:hypothetical protein BACPU_23450 [Bacillus pumilus]|nr:hypothetical protein BACPU_23450 [Bacillus pumilus]